MDGVWLKKAIEGDLTSGQLSQLEEFANRIEEMNEAGYYLDKAAVDYSGLFFDRRGRLKLLDTNAVTKREGNGPEWLVSKIRSLVRDKKEMVA